MRGYGMLALQTGGACVSLFASVRSAFIKVRIYINMFVRFSSPYACYYLVL